MSCAAPIRRIFAGPASFLLLALLGLATLAPAAAQDSRRPQEIVFNDLPDHLGTDGPFDLVANASSGLPVTLELIAGPAVITGNSIRLTGLPGIVVVRAVQAGNADFRPAVPAERAFSVKEKPVTPTITAQPHDLTVALGDTAVLSGDASGVPTPTYQWRKNGAEVPGATDRTLSFPGVTAASAGTYDFVARNSAGTVVSGRATLSVAKRTQFISFQTPSMSIPVGQPIMLNASASSGLPVSFELVSGMAILNGSLLSGSGPGSATVRATQQGDGTFAAATAVTQTFTFSAPATNQTLPGHP